MSYQVAQPVRQVMDATARWHCLVCGLATPTLSGPHAVLEVGHLAVIHDRIHHGGALTARVVISNPAPLPEAATPTWTPTEAQAV